MHSFKDFKGQQWDIELVRSKLRVITSRTKVDLLSLYEVDAEDQLSNLQAVISDEDKLLEVLAVACETQIIERKLTASEFGDLLKAEALDDAADALLREGASFFPAARRSAIISVLDTARAVAKNFESMLSVNFNVTEEADRISKLLLESMASGQTTNPPAEPSTISAGGSPDASGSTPTDIAFQNSASFTLPLTDNAGITPPRS